MERRVLKLGGRSYGDGMEGAVWKELEGMDGMDGRSGMEGVGRYGWNGWKERYGRNGWNSVQRYNFSLILPNLGV